MVRRLVSDFTNKPDLLQAISALGLGAWVMELAAANSAFAENYLVRARDTAGSNPESVRLRRKQISDAWLVLRNRLNSNYTIQEDLEPV